MAAITFCGSSEGLTVASTLISISDWMLGLLNSCPYPLLLSIHQQFHTHVPSAVPESVRCLRGFRPQVPWLRLCQLKARACPCRQIRQYSLARLTSLCPLGA